MALGISLDAIDAISGGHDMKYEEVYEEMGVPRAMCYSPGGWMVRWHLVDG